MSKVAERVSFLNEKISRTERVVDYIRLVAICLVILMIFLSRWMAVNWFSYEVIEEKTRREAYEHPIKTVSTYVCYTTTYGSYYHAGGCQSLWNSSYKTTVYEAKERGYGNCSKCEPSVKTTLTLTETRYKDVKYQETKTKEPQFLVFIGSTAIIIALYYIITAPAKITLRKDRKELQLLETPPQERPVYHPGR